MSGPRWLAAAPLLALLNMPVVAGSTTSRDLSALLELSLEELGQIEVTSVSRREERRRDSPADVHVITREDIRRSGVTSIPEALRLAPGVEVARNGANSWTITMRGFNSDLSNKLLVLIDGRSVYSPLFAGVYWDAQNTLMEDIERIEVIGGPGGTMWGANAVNGVINIITRSAWDTEGVYVEAGVGNELEYLAGARYAGRLGEHGAARAYVKSFEHDASVTRAGDDAQDDWDMHQAGFRTDWMLGDDAALTVQGDIYDGEQSALLRGDFTLGTLPEENVPGQVDISGHNLLARYQRPLQQGASVRLQAYYDHTERDIPGTFAESRDTFDVELVHDLAQHGRHHLIWGAGVRVTDDDLDNTRFATFDPASRRDETYSLFLQDKITLVDETLFLTLGSKYEHNDYSGDEHQPNARLLWRASDRHTFWAAVSRAVRIPARLNEDLTLYAPVDIGAGMPLYVNVRSPEDFEPERLVAQEAGYRARLTDTLSLDLAVYRHDYDRLMTNEVAGPVTVVPGPPPYLVLPVVQGNGMRGETYGGNLDVKWQPLPHWRLEFQLSHIDFDLESRSRSGDENALNVAGNSPKYQGAVHSFLQLPRGLSLYAGVRYVDDLPNQDVPSYVAVDVNLEWQVSDALRAGVSVRNLGDPEHPEFGDGNQVERSVLARLSWRF